MVKEGDTVQINTPGETCHEDTGKVVSVSRLGTVAVDLVGEGERWYFRTEEVEVTKTAQQEGE